MAITIPGVPSSRKTPGIYLNVILGGPGAGGADTTARVLLLGNKIESNIVLTDPAMTIVAGSSPLNTPIEVFDKERAAELFGYGSELHLMCVAAFSASPNVKLFACPFGQAAGAVRATATLTLTGTAPTGDLLVVLYCNNERIEVVIPASSTIDAIGTAIAQAILDRNTLPIYAQYNAGTDVVTFSHKNAGARGNNTNIKIDITNAVTTSKLRTGSLAATLNGTTFTLSSAKLAGGTGTETTTFTAATSVILPERWHRIAVSVEDTTNLTSLAAQAVSVSSATLMLWSQVVAANTRDYGATLSGGVGGPDKIAAAINNPRCQLLWQENSDKSLGEIAAHGVVARLMGDSFRGGLIVGEQDDPSCNLDGLLVSYIPDQEAIEDKPLATIIEAALNNGVTPLVSSGVGVRMVRSITTRFKDTTGAVNYSVIDTSEVTVVDRVAEELRTAMQSAWQSAKLVDDLPNGSPPRIANAITPKLARSFILALLKEREERGWITNVDGHASALIVQRDVTVRGRLNCEIPVEPSPPLHVFGGNVRQTSS